MQTACMRADQVLTTATLDNDNIDACQGQLAREHHSRRISADDHHGMLAHRDASVGTPPVATGASDTLIRARTPTASARDNNMCIPLVSPFRMRASAANYATSPVACGKGTWGV